MTATFTKDDDLRSARFTGTRFSGARFIECDLDEVVMRGVSTAGLDIDAPWLTGGHHRLLVNGVDVTPFVEATLNERFPGRAARFAETLDGLRAAWESVQAAWQAALNRAESLPPGSVDVSVDGEWSFAQTLRHLVLATDVWLGRAVLGLEQPFHPLGLVDDWAQDSDVDLSDFTTEEPSWQEVLNARADRVAMVTAHLTDLDEDELARQVANPWDATHPGETVRSCLHVILEEEWEHLRFALRDLDQLATISQSLE